jgi:hypothetical protein
MGSMTRPTQSLLRSAAVVWALAAAFRSTGCVSPGDAGTATGEAGVVIGATVIASQIARSAHSGDAPARSLWCTVLGKVDAQLSLWQGQDRSEDELVEELTPLVNAAAREAGYQMHRVQIRTLIVDAANVRADPAALAAESGRCR